MLNRRNKSALKLHKNWNLHKHLWSTSNDRLFLTKEKEYILELRLF